MYKIFYLYKYMSKFPPICTSDYPEWIEEDRIFLCSYRNDWDMDDLAEHYSIYGNLPMDYKLISSVMLASKYPDRYTPKLKAQFDELNEELPPGKKITQETFIMLIVDQINRLNIIMTQKLPSIAETGITGPVTLWSGKATDFGLESLTPGSPWKWANGKFLSTSLSPDSALRFASNQGPYILIKITIPEHKLSEIPYTALLDKEVTVPFDHSLMNGTIPVYLEENEFLIPPGAELIFKGRRDIPNVSFNKPNANGQITSHVLPLVNEYEFEYVGISRRASKIKGELKLFYGVSGGTSKNRKEGNK